jgi:hypothetical protein
MLDAGEFKHEMDTVAQLLSRSDSTWLLSTARYSESYSVCSTGED